MQVVVRAGMSGNGVPVFMVSGQSPDLGRPFGASFDASRSLWLYPAYFPCVTKVLADFKKISKIDWVFSEQAQKHVDYIEKVKVAYRDRVLPGNFEYVTKPYDHQVEGLVHAYYMMRAALFYAPGLGKSKIAIDFIRLLHLMKQTNPVIIFGPLVTVENWGKEIDRHSGGQLTWQTVLGTKKKKLEAIERVAAGGVDVMLITYDTAARYVDKIFQTIDYKTGICDESHLIKNWASNRTKAAHELGQKMSRKIILTGTPTLGDPLDLYGQYKFLADSFMPENYVQYQAKFLEYSTYNEHVVVGFKNLDILNERTKFVAIQKTKEECLDLPERTLVNVSYWLSPHQVTIYNQLASELKIDVDNVLYQLAVGPRKDIPPPAEMPHAAAMLNKLQQVASGFVITNNMNPKLCEVVEPGGCRFAPECSAKRILPFTPQCQVAPDKIPDTITYFEENPKLEALMGTLDQVLADPTAKCIVWAYYRPELDLIQKALEEAKISFVRVDGSTGRKIQTNVDKFNDDPTVKVYLGQVSTGVGITLNAASYMVYYSLPYSLGSYLQSIDRNYRIGQKKNVTVYHLLGEQTIEPAILALLDRKVDVDHVMTHRLSCVVCPKNIECLAKDVELFDDECIHKRTMVRPVTKAHVISYRKDPL